MVAPRGACMVDRRGMRGCSGGRGVCVVAPGGGGCVVALGGSMCGIRRDTEILSMECILVCVSFQTISN